MFLLRKVFTIIFVAVSLCAVLGCFGSSTTESSNSLPDFKPQLAKKMVSEGALLIDVRTQAEFDAGAVPGAQLIPVQEFAQKINEIKKMAGNDLNKPIVVYCKVGGRAAKAKKILENAGFTKVTNMGGYKDWPKN